MREAVFGSQPGGSYSPGIVAEGRLLFVSGQGPRHGDSPIPNDVATQTRSALSNVARVLAEAGAGLTDVVRCGVYLRRINDFDAMDAAYRECFPEPRPARTTVGADLPGILVEIDCVAVLPQAAQ